MLKKIYRSLGDSWGEVLGNVILLVLVGPLWLLLNGFAYAWGFIGLVLRFPAPKQIPPVVTNDKLTPKQKAKIYAEKFKETVSGLKFTKGSIHDLPTTVISNQHAKVEIWLDDDLVGLTIDGLNSDFWHTLEMANIDLHFWVAVGALRNGIKWGRAWTGRKEGWVYSDEMEIWVVVSAGESNTSYIKYKRHYRGDTHQRPSTSQSAHA